jgi:NADH:ubiquinone oxidoreductase subunit 2 (subunit N)
LAAVQLAGAALAALTGDRPPSLSIGYGAVHEAQSTQALCSLLRTESNYCYLSDGLRVAAVSLVSLGLHALAVVLALGYVARTRRKPIGRLGGLAGLARSHPGSAAAIGVALWSVAGLAPTLGAMGGVMRLGVAISAGWPGVAVGWAATGALSVVACLRVIVAMLRPAPGDAPVGDVPVEPMAGGIGQLWRVAITAAVAAVVAGGVWPELLMEPLTTLLP